MTKTATSPYDVAEHLRTPEEMAAYLEVCMEEADGDAAFIAKALGDIARAKGMSQGHPMRASPAKAFTRRFRESAIRHSTRYSGSSERSV